MRFIRLKEVMHVTGLGRSSIYNYMAEGRFPKTVSLGGRAVAWVESEITDWIQAKIAQRTN
ncbi:MULTISPECIES: AlpA family transcriptional regulator [Photobacterium]|uniref:AlpA family transcriptional regulator n=1 Tax=Photobacterium toruni TaxID=1935446 RepID=A0ABU6L4Z8_9GAMM|nr:MULTISPECIES: AlpA family transcriptional regulator [Photobacterium]MBE8127393.1 AlpA family transcriptional regulator [Photobacterium damselae subsp. piscicida]MEC6815050.1 AlpA family transcriptional regulator [Photobacterium toruni]MEC6831062.1 AlpA family transcriptional regulator [Photobacterium toruni]MEC6881802.1 AlpA family transcriptional regulator [Photobacterium piscicola]MEC6909197.1 AlpA family transcriptional regulator [Photobacterium piscicola]